MKNALDDPVAPAEATRKADRQNHRAGGLGKHGSIKDMPSHAHDAGYIAHIERLGHNQALAQADGAPQQEGKNRCQSHEAQAAALDQKQDYTLAEAAPVRIGIHQHQAGHAGGRGGGKQAGEKRGRLPRCARTPAGSAAPRPEGSGPKSPASRSWSDLNIGGAADA